MRLYKRGKAGTWWVDLGTAGGASPRRSTGTTDKKAAEEYAATLARDLWRTQRLGEAPRVTWDAAVVAWLDDHQHRKSIEEIKRVLRWLSERLQGVALADITDARIRALAKARREQPANAQDIAKALAAGRTPPPPRQTSGATINRHLAQLSAVLHDAHRRGWLPGGVPPITKAAEPKKRVAWLTRDEANRLLEELPPHLAAIASFALATGLRESNVRLLRWSQVDQARAVCWHEGDDTKSGKALSTPLNVDALRVLARQWGRHRVWVFPVPRWVDGKQVADEPTGKVSNHAWRKACIRAGLPDLRFHDLRHTWASWHAQAGTPLAVLQELGGWASLAMVQRYAHLGTSHVAQWAGNSLGTAAGTKPAHAAHTETSRTNDDSPEGLSNQGVSMGWLIGLEPTTTRITIGARGVDANKIKHLPARKKPKTA